MTIIRAHAAALRPGRLPISWKAPEPGLWVASRGDDYAGFVEYSDGYFVATDYRGVVQGSRRTLQGAKRDLVNPAGTLLVPFLFCGGVALAGTAYSFALIALGLAVF